MLSEELIQARDKILMDLKYHPRMSLDIKIGKLTALRAIYKKDNDISHELWANFELRKALNKKLDQKLPASETKKLLKEYWGTFLIGAKYSFHDYMLYLEHRRDPEKKFYENRLKQLRPIVNDLQDLYDGKLKRLGISLPPGVGKAQPLYSKVLTPTGFKNMGDVHVGDQLISGSGKYCHVIGVFPQGVKDVYRVVFNDGTSTECCKEHIWHVQTRDDRHKKLYGPCGRYRDVQLQDMLHNLRVENGRRLNYSVDYVRPIHFTGKQLPLHPYVMGVLLGDGALSSGNLNFTSVDTEIIQKVKDLLPDGDTISRRGKSISYRIKKSSYRCTKRGCPAKATTQQVLEHYGLLNSKSESKHIPHDYLVASVDDRWELLRGLLDTDGYTNKHVIEYTTVSKTLCYGIMSLVRSLGGRATVATKCGAYQKNGVRVRCKLVYRVVIVFNSSARPFSLSRKSNALNIKRDTIKKFIDHVEYVGERECQCIMVDDPSQLYITDDYIITHNTTLIIFYLTWVMGKDPLMPNLYSGYADKLCRGAFDGIMSIMKDPEYCYNEIFPNSPIATTNAKDESIDLVKPQRFKTFTARSLDSGLTGATRCENILVLDDAVSGIEEAMNLDRLDSLWMKVTNDLFSRAKESCRYLLIGTRWSCHDVLGRMEERYADDPQSKFIRIPALDVNGNSNFEYKHGVGFSREYFKNMRDNMDDVSWRAIYQQEPIEREGLLYQKDELHRFFELPETKPDAIVAVCDSKNQGKDYVCALCGYLYGDSVFIPDLVFNNGLPEVTKPLVAKLCVDNKVSRMDIESNNGGEYYARGVDEQIHKLGGFTSIRTFFTSSNKITKIITESDYVKKHFVFLDESKQDEAYRKFMRNFLGFTVNGKVKHDDGCDAAAMLSELVKGLTGAQINVIQRPF